MNYDHGNKTCTIRCTIESNSPGFTSSTGDLNFTTNGSSANTTITLNTPIQPGSNYTISFSKVTGDNNGKIRISDISFQINP